MAEQQNTNSTKAKGAPKRHVTRRPYYATMRANYVTQHNKIRKLARYVRRHSNDEQAAKQMIKLFKDFGTDALRKSIHPDIRLMLVK